MKKLFAKILERLTRPVANRLELASGSKLLNNEVVAQKVKVQERYYGV